MPYSTDTSTAAAVIQPGEPARGTDMSTNIIIYMYIESKPLLKSM